MTLTTSFLDQMVLNATHMLSGLMESVTYYAKSGPTASPVTHAGLQANFEQYNDRQIDQELILREDRRLRVARKDITWTVTQWDELTRSDGSRWRVLNASEGSGRPWYLMQLRRIA